MCGARAAVQAKPPQISMQAAREEAELVMFTSIKELLDSCGMSPRQVRARTAPWPDSAADLTSRQQGVCARMPLMHPRRAVEDACDRREPMVAREADEHGSD